MPEEFNDTGCECGLHCTLSWGLKSGARFCVLIKWLSENSRYHYWLHAREQTLYFHGNPSHHVVVNMGKSVMDWMNVVFVAISADSSGDATAKQMLLFPLLDATKTKQKSGRTTSFPSSQVSRYACGYCCLHSCYPLVPSPHSRLSKTAQAALTSCCNFAKAKEGLCERMK